MNAALTGHILLTTFNANDAPTAIPRLLDMDVEPFLLSSTLELVVAQRLIRTICENCRASANGAQRALIKELTRQRAITKSIARLYAGKGCDQCSHTGYRGRTALYEMIAITPEMRELILKAPSIQEIRALCKEQGSTTLFDDGVSKVEQGVTTIDEVLRVVEPPQPLAKRSRKKL